MTVFYVNSTVGHKLLCPMMIIYTHYQGQQEKNLRTKLNRERAMERTMEEVEK